MKPFLSVCMIVKNEEKVLRRCLESISGIADEIIIADTGSMDKTKDIAYEFTSQVYDYIWEDDFSKARNFAASKASGDWIMAIDADEYVDWDSFLTFKEGFAENPSEYNILAVQIVNFVGNNGKDTVLNYHERIYKNDGSISYYRNIHEMLKHDSLKECNGIANLKIYHSGYMEQVVKEKNKSKRNLYLLESKKNRAGIDYYFLGNEYYQLGDFDKAIKHYKKGYQLKESIDADWVKKLLVRMANCLHSAKRDNEALEIIKASEEVFVKLVDFPFLKGKILFSKGHLTEAAEVFKGILSKKNDLQVDSSMEYLEYLPHKYLGYIYESEGELQLAVHHYSKALSINDSDDDLWIKLISLLALYSPLDELVVFINDKLNRSSMNAKRIVKILLKIPNSEVQKLTNSFILESSLTIYQRDALILKNLLLNGMLSEVRAEILSITFNHFNNMMETELFSIIDFIVVTMETEESKFREILKKINCQNSMKNLLEFLLENEVKKLSLFEEEILLIILKQAILLNQEKTITILNELLPFLSPIGKKLMGEILAAKNTEQIWKNPKDRNPKMEIEELIHRNELDAAKQLIKKYETVFSNDADFCSMQAIICILENMDEEAEKFLFKGLEIEPDNVNILYNLGYLFDHTDNAQRAYNFYNRALLRSKSKEVVGEIRSRIDEMDTSYPQMKKKKVLLVAYAFPPIGGPGVQRTLKFAKYLSDFGWSPIVLTVGASALEKTGESLLKEINEDIDVIRINDFNPEDITNRDLKDIHSIFEELINDKELFSEYLTALEKNIQDDLIFIPDYQVFWANKVIKYIERYINIEELDLVYTSADPNSDNIIGYYLKRIYQKPWVADLRDAWTKNPYANYDKTSIKYKIECQMEKTLLSYADKIVTVSEVISNDYKQSLAAAEKNIITITNGYDESDFAEMKKSDQKNERFTIVHNGLFYQKRSPLTFLTALNNILDQGLVARDQIRVYFTRKDSSFNMVKDFGLSDVVYFTGYMDHQKSLEFSKDTDLLLLVVGSGDENKGIYTGKVFEYLRLNKPILSLTPKDSVVDQLLEETNRGKNIPYEDIEGIEKYLVHMYSIWKSKEYPELQVTEQIRSFERIELTGRLADVFNQSVDQFTVKLDKEADFYNGIYKTGGWNQTYFKHYSQIHYYPIWIEALAKIKDIEKPTVIDIGCGPGQFANLLFDHNIRDYLGIDFSSEAIHIAKKNNPAFKGLFSIGDAFKSEIFYTKYNTVVLFEILEHIDDDLKLLGRIKEDANVLLSVPNFYTDGHVRWFDNMNEVNDRYKDLINIKSVTSFNLNHQNKIFLLYGTKKKDEKTTDFQQAKGLKTI